MPIIDFPNQALRRLDLIGFEQLKAYQFAVQMDTDSFGTQYVAGFDQILGVGDSVRIREVREGGYPGTYRFPRQSNSDQIQLVQGMTFNRGLWEWYESVRNWKRGLPNYTRTLSIMLLDHIGAPRAKEEPIQYEVWRFDIIDAWPSQWRGPDMNAMSENRAFESITIQHRGISRAESLVSGTAAQVISLLQQA